MSRTPFALWLGVSLCLIAGQTGARAQAPETLKERLWDKASDAQRVDNCRVPEDRRGATPRPDCAADAPLSIAQVRDALATAPAGKRPSFRGQSLRDLDLSGLNLSGVDLSAADLSGAKLVGTNLAGANLSGALLNLAWIMGANFDRANLSDAVLETLVVSAGLQTTPAEAASFVNANLSGAHIMARFSLDDMRGANFSHAQMAADMRNQSMGLIHTDFSSAKLNGANFSGAALGHVSFRFADLAGANFSGADLRHADFSGADLTGANLTGADATDADFDDARLKGALGIETVKGLRTG
ncbi:MAG TPA: pentapeptide repeat-containing protein [Acetobacteraceae bacterium]|nr:pentapeptide repeat-containing protein [Acetobacteraceae bacterium]